MEELNFGFRMRALKASSMPKQKNTDYNRRRLIFDRRL